MRRLADASGASTVPDERWPELIEAATFGRMRERADQLAPDRLGVLRDRQAFFRQGRSGHGAGCWTRPAWPATESERGRWPRPTCSPGCTATGSRSHRRRNRRR